jgi:hypothetical protein
MPARSCTPEAVRASGATRPLTPLVGSILSPSWCSATIGHTICTGNAHLAFGDVMRGETKFTIQLNNRPD